MTKNTSSGKTPKLITDLLQKSVAEKGQSAVARESGIALYSIQRYLKGIGEPTSKTLQKLADYFGVSVWELRGDFDVKDFCKNNAIDAYSIAKDDPKLNVMLNDILNLSARLIFYEKSQNPNITKEELTARLQSFMSGFYKELEELVEDVENNFSVTEVVKQEDSQQE